MVFKSACRFASRDLDAAFPKLIVPIVASTAIMPITTKSSISVNPDSRLYFFGITFFSFIHFHLLSFWRFVLWAYIHYPQFTSHYTIQGKTRKHLYSFPRGLGHLKHRKHNSHY